jgi:hypothetical protein
VIAVVSSSFRCRLRLSCPSDIAVVCRLGPLFACCLVAGRCQASVPYAIVAFRALPQSLLVLSSFGASRSTLSFFCLLRMCPLRRATPARRVIFFPAAANSFHDPLFPWNRICLKTCLHLRHATAARRNTFLQAAANFLRDPQYPLISFFGSPRRPADRCRPLCHFFIVPKDFTATSSVGTSRYSTSD